MSTSVLARALTDANIDKARSVLNWHPQISIEQGINMTVDWDLANTDWLDKIQIDS